MTVTPAGISFRYRSAMSANACYRHSWWKSAKIPRKVAAVKHLWNAEAAKAAPIGAGSFFALAAVALCCVAFDLLIFSPPALADGRLPGLLLAVGYLLFAPAVACGIYSSLFEAPKSLALAGLALSVLIVALEFFTVTVFLDGLLLLPFWFLAVMGTIKFVKWRRSRRMHLGPSQ